MWLYILGGTLLLTLIGFYGFVPKFSANNQDSTLTWLYKSWNWENQYYEHGWIVVAVMGWFVYKAWAPMRAEPVRGSMHGLWWVALGIFFWVGGMEGRTA